jgi:exodeoxyribonuclease-3
MAEVEGLRFASLYCPNGKHTGHEDFPKKLGWFDALAGYLASQRADEPLVLAGDFNVCPTGLDSWDEERLAGEIFHTDEERGRFRRLLDWGLRDLYREKHPEGRDFSWWDYRGGAFHRGHGLRIDFLLGTEPVVARLESIEIDREWRKKHDGLTASDHAPVMAELR